MSCIYPLSDDIWIKGKSVLKAMQYMALDVPTIVSNIGQTKFIIRHRNYGFLVNNQNEWINTILKLNNNLLLRTTIGIGSRKKIKELYSFDLIAKKYLSVIKSIKK